MAFELCYLVFNVPRGNALIVLLKERSCLHVVLLCLRTLPRLRIELEFKITFPLRGIISNRFMTSLHVLQGVARLPSFETQDGG